MEVIKEGTVAAPEVWTANVDCPKCKATLAIKADDLQRFHYYGTHFRHDYAGISCTRCGHIQAVKKIPEPVLKIVMAKRSTFDGFDDRI